MSDPMLVVFAYDTPDDKRRRRIARALEDVADRVQYSVFEGVLTAAQLDEAINRLQGFLDPEHDNLRVYRLCSYCRAAAVTMGPAGSLVELPTYWIV